jgi:hypothetical protein
MNPRIVIRSETDADVSAIAEVTVAAREFQIYQKIQETIRD